MFAGFQRHLAKPALAALLPLLLASCKDLMGTLGGERVCLKLNTVTAKPTEQTVRRIVKRLETELQFQQIYYNPKETFNDRVFSQTVLSNSKNDPGWDLVINYDPPYSILRCSITTSEYSDAGNVKLAKRVTQVLQEMFPGSAPYNCTAYRGLLGP